MLPVETMNIPEGSSVILMKNLLPKDNDASTDSIDKGVPLPFDSAINAKYKDKEDRDLTDCGETEKKNSQDSKNSSRGENDTRNETSSTDINANNSDKEDRDMTDGGEVHKIKSQVSRTSSRGDNSSRNESKDSMTLNQFDAKKRYVMSLFNVALFMANASQLKSLVTLGRERFDIAYYCAMLSLIVLSMVLQVIFVLLQITIAAKYHKDSNASEVAISCDIETGRKNSTGSVNSTSSISNGGYCLETMEWFCVIIVFFIIIVNTIITAFGLVAK